MTLNEEVKALRRISEFHKEEELSLEEFYTWGARVHYDPKGSQVFIALHNFSVTKTLKSAVERGGGLPVFVGHVPPEQIQWFDPVGHDGQLLLGDGMHTPVKMVK